VFNVHYRHVRFWYYPGMRIYAAHLWDALSRIGRKDGTANKIAPAVIAKLIKLKIAKLDAAGRPQLTAKGRRVFAVMESGDGDVPKSGYYED
jgi:hypothetical protein